MCTQSLCVSDVFVFYTVSITDRSYGGSYLCPLCCGLCCLVCAIMCSQLLACKVSILEQTDFNSLQIIMLQYVPSIQFTVLPLCCMLNLSLVLYQFSLPPGCVLNMSLVLDQFHLVCDGITRGTLDTRNPMFSCIIFLCWLFVVELEVKHMHSFFF